MRFVRSLLVIAVVLAGTVQFTSAQGQPRPNDLTTGLTTLFARDPLTQSLCFRDGGPGLVFRNGQKLNRCSDLNFDSYTANAFSVGIEGGRQGVIVDLGSPQELRGKYGYTETVGGGQGFASIDVRNGEALILKDYRTGQLQSLTEAALLFSAPAPGYKSVPVKVGHIYLMRVTDRDDKTFEMLAKFLVLAYVPGESVTVRWNLLSGTKMAKL